MSTSTPTPTHHTHQSHLAQPKPSSVWIKMMTSELPHTPSPMGLPPPYVTRPPLPSNTLKRLAATSINLSASSNNKRLKYATSKPGEETSTCHQHLSGMEGEWIFKCPARVERTSSL